MNMGPMDPDNLKCVFLINALGDQFSSLQSSIQSMSEDANFSSSSIVKRLHAEESLLRRQGELGLQPEALAAIGKTRKPGNLLCAHCKRTNHLTDYCIHPGGKMAGKTVEEARAAQRAALSKPPLPMSPLLLTLPSPLLLKQTPPVPPSFITVSHTTLAPPPHPALLLTLLFTPAMNRHPLATTVTTLMLPSKRFKRTPKPPSTGRHTPAPLIFSSPSNPPLLILLGTLFLSISINLPSSSTLGPLSMSLLNAPTSRPGLQSHPVLLKALVALASSLPELVPSISPSLPVTNFFYRMSSIFLAQPSALSLSSPSTVIMPTPATLAITHAGSPTNMAPLSPAVPSPLLATFSRSTVPRPTSLIPDKLAPPLLNLLPCMPLAFLT